MLIYNYHHICTTSHFIGSSMKVNIKCLKHTWSLKPSACLHQLTFAFVYSDWPQMPYIDPVRQVSESENTSVDTVFLLNLLPQHNTLYFWQWFNILQEVTTIESVLIRWSETGNSFYEHLVTWSLWKHLLEFLDSGPWFVTVKLQFSGTWVTVRPCEAASVRPDFGFNL